ncbi:MAG: HAD family hydrolase [Bdellovibrionales bacterium]
MIKAVIFDLDGVLVDARDWHYQSLNRALALFGLEIPRDDHLVTYDGLPTRKKLEMLSIERGLPTDLHAFINKMKQVYTMELIYTQCRPVFHCQYALNRLRKRGLRMAVCSNSIRETMDLMLTKSALMPFFEFTLSNQDVKLPKPDPEIYREAIRRLSVPAENVLILEDNQNGVEAAKAAGAHLLHVRSISDVNAINIARRLIELGGPEL